MERMMNTKHEEGCEEGSWGWLKIEMREAKRQNGEGVRQTPQFENETVRRRNIWIKIELNQSDGGGGILID